jgi:hypothetical protein
MVKNEYVPQIKTMTDGVVFCEIKPVFLELDYCNTLSLPNWVKKGITCFHEILHSTHSIMSYNESASKKKPVVVREVSVKQRLNYWS